MKIIFLLTAVFITACAPHDFVYFQNAEKQTDEKYMINYNQSDLYINDFDML